MGVNDDADADDDVVVDAAAEVEDQFAGRRIDHDDHDDDDHHDDYD